MALTTPCIGRADLGIAMGKGTDSAIETADVVLMQDHLGKRRGHQNRKTGQSDYQVEYRAFLVAEGHCFVANDPGLANPVDCNHIGHGRHHYRYLAWSHHPAWQGSGAEIRILI